MFKGALFDLDGVIADTASYTSMHGDKLFSNTLRSLSLIQLRKKRKGLVARILFVSF